MMNLICGTLLEKQRQNHKWHSLIDSFTWSCDCWLTSKNFNRSSAWTLAVVWMKSVLAVQLDDDVCIYIYLYIYVCICVYIFIYVYIYMYVFTYIHMYIFMCIYSVSQKWVQPSHFCRYLSISLHGKILTKWYLDTMESSLCAAYITELIYFPLKITQNITIKS